MRIREDSVAVRVPATSANLGPGFDALGLALNHWDEVSVRATTGATHVTIDGHGQGTVPTDDDNLVVRAMRLALDHVGAPQVGIDMRAKNRIPHGRGMGSSAAAIVAGLGLARALVGDPAALSATDLLQLGTDLEGHPDNIAPAIFGGATIAWMNDGNACAVRLSPPASLHPMVFIPDFEVSTSAARKALPEKIPHTDASYNSGRAALLAAILTGAEGRGIDCGNNNSHASLHDFLMDATQDRLHQEYRRHVMTPSMALVDWLRENGYPATISGAGPTVISFEEVPTDICVQARTAGWTVLATPVSEQGLQTTRGRLAESAI